MLGRIGSLWWYNVSWSLRELSAKKLEEQFLYFINIWLLKFSFMLNLLGGRKSLEWIRTMLL